MRPTSGCCATPTTPPSCRTSAGPAGTPCGSRVRYRTTSCSMPSTAPTTPWSASSPRKTAPSPGRSGRQAQRLGQSAVAVGQLVVRGGQQLDGHVVGARLEMLVELGGNLIAGAPGDQRVDQRVAAAVAQVLLAPAQAAQVAGVVDQPEVWALHPRAADRAGSLRVG